MKFTKTLAISLLALGAMQFAMAETVKIDLTDAEPGEVATRYAIAGSGDIVEVTFLDLTGQEINKFAPLFLKFQKDFLTDNIYGITGLRYRTVAYEVVGKPAAAQALILGPSEDKPVYIIKIKPPSRHPRHHGK